MDHKRREPAPGRFRLVLPLPFPGLDKVNAYALTGEEGVTLVDCGIFDPGAADHGWGDLVAALRACDLAVEGIVRLIVTHPHVDHYGMAARLKDEVGCELWLHGEAKEDIERFEHPEGATAMLRRMLTEHGVDEKEIDELASFEDWRTYISGIAIPDRWLAGGEGLSIGQRSWRILYTPGHSAAHICLWAEEDRVLISGDHLLPTITPHIDFRRGEDHDPLGEFLESLTLVEQLEPALVLPGHGRPFEDGAGRARVVERHHDRRLGSILQVIRHEAHTANEVTEEIFGTTLLNFQRRFALGETLAHLAYLRNRGEVERERGANGIYMYMKTPRSRSASR